MMKKLELPSGAGGVFLFGTEAEIAEQERGFEAGDDPADDAQVAHGSS